MLSLNQYTAQFRLIAQLIHYLFPILIEPFTLSQILHPCPNRQLLIEYYSPQAWQRKVTIFKLRLSLILKRFNGEKSGIFEALCRCVDARLLVRNGDSVWKIFLEGHNWDFPAVADVGNEGAKGNSAALAERRLWNAGHMSRGNCPRSMRISESKGSKKG